VPALLSRYRIDAILADKAKLILKNESGKLECDSAVEALISPILGFIPFVSHIVYTYRITFASVGTDPVCAQ